MDKHVEFKDAGKWAQHDPAAPAFTVEAGEVVILDSATADDCVETGKARFVSAPDYTADEEPTVDEPVVTDPPANAPPVMTTTQPAAESSDTNGGGAPTETSKAAPWDTK